MRVAGPYRLLVEEQSDSTAFHQRSISGWRLSCLAWGWTATPQSSICQNPHTQSVCHWSDSVPSCLMSSRNSPLSSFATEPAASTGHIASSTKVTLIRWVFPKTATTVIDRDAKVLGRDGDCNTVLLGREVSRRHAELQRQGALTVIRDLGSRNGVFVNGAPVPHAALKNQDVVRIGEWLGVVDMLGDAQAAGFRSITASWYGGPTLANAVEPARRIANSNLPVIVQGETGTGKEGLARAIHGWSGRIGPFVAVNCATITPELAEATLFGHRKGAFTGADRAALGFFRAANRGTLFLDEVAELPLAVQSKLLRALEQREIVPVGDTEPVAVDVRVLTAAQESLQVAVGERRFRADLYARLDGLAIVLPPLRQRREDIAPLLMAFLHDNSSGKPPEVDHKLVEQLLLYDWPLNVRELVQLARQLLILHAAEPLLKRSFLPERMQPLSDRRTANEEKPSRKSTEDQQAFDRLVVALQANDGNVARAAESLGITRSRANRLLEARPDFDVNSLRGKRAHP